MCGEQFAPIHAHFAFTKRVVDPHTDPEAHNREGENGGKIDQVRLTEGKQKPNS